VSRRVTRRRDPELHVSHSRRYKYMKKQETYREEHIRVDKQCKHFEHLDLRLAPKLETRLLGRLMWLSDRRRIATDLFLPCRSAPKR
jgi:hypothetical protein